MKIGIAAVGSDMDSQVSDRFGRTPYFIIYDTDSGSFEAVPNEVGGGGAGVKAGMTLASKGVEYVITGGGVGPNAYEALNSAGIKIIGNTKGTVKEVAERFKNGELQPTQDVLVEGKHEH
jgi:predicted Fe-Mo cluster-binding NifX family protein